MFHGQPCKTNVKHFVRGQPSKTNVVFHVFWCVCVCVRLCVRCLIVGPIVSLLVSPCVHPFKCVRQNRAGGLSASCPRVWVEIVSFRSCVHGRGEAKLCGRARGVSILVLGLFGGNYAYTAPLKSCRLSTVVRGQLLNEHHRKTNGL